MSTILTRAPRSLLTRSELANTEADSMPELGTPTRSLLSPPPSVDAFRPLPQASQHTHRMVGLMSAAITRGILRPTGPAAYETWFYLAALITAPVKFGLRAAAIADELGVPLATVEAAMASGALATDLVEGKRYARLEHARKWKAAGAPTTSATAQEKRAIAAKIRDEHPDFARKLELEADHDATKASPGRHADPRRGFGGFGAFILVCRDGGMSWDEILDGFYDAPHAWAPRPPFTEADLKRCGWLRAGDDGDMAARRHRLRDTLNTAATEEAKRQGVSRSRGGDRRRKIAR